MSTVDTIGIMFATNDASREYPFPTLGELERMTDYLNLHSFRGELEDNGIIDWYVIAYNPTVYGYSDEAHEAIDVTNWRAILNELPISPADLPNFGPNVGRDNVWVLEDEMTEALDVGIAIVRGWNGNVLAIRNDGWTDDKWHNPLDRMKELQDRLSDYPLLDEEAYLGLEYEAWVKWAPEAWRGEIIEAVRDGALTEAQAAALESIGGDDLDRLLHNLSNNLNYSDGFSGEYAPPLLDVFRASAKEWDHAVKHEHHGTLDFP